MKWMVEAVEDNWYEGLALGGKNNIQRMQCGTDVYYC